MRLTGNPWELVTRESWQVWIKPHACLSWLTALVSFSFRRFFLVAASLDARSLKHLCHSLCQTWVDRSLQWVPEITHHCQKTPFLLVGTQSDLRDDPATLEKLSKNRQKPISPELGEKLAKELKAVKFVECSALTQASRQLLIKRSVYYRFMCRQVPHITSYKLVFSSF